jgi:hypothetical protein
LPACSGKLVARALVDAGALEMATEAGALAMSIDATTPATSASTQTGIPAANPPAPLDAGVMAGEPAPVVDAGPSVASLDAAEYVDAVAIDASGDRESAAGCGSKSPSFALDVLPVFARGCTLSSECHGQMNNVAEESLYLGEIYGNTNSSTVYNQLVGVKAKEIPSMNLVTPGDVENSYLWRKSRTMDDLMTLASQCMAASMPLCNDCTTSTPCGATMPYLNTPLSEASPDDMCTLTNWIQNGAQNN